VGLIPENELSRSALIIMDPVTCGPVVNQFMQTSVLSIFACGNVVHVNDLADNVSVESEVAGKEAANYALNKFPAVKGRVICRSGTNIRYIVPQYLDLGGEDQEITLYFRVSAPQSKVRICAKLEGRELCSKKVIKVNPGEMEQLTVKSKDLRPGNIVINVEGE
jgi:hypothetical protein